MEGLIEIILHTDNALTALVSQNVTKAYFILFLIVFCETGLIVAPFLPGDGLLFSAGVVAVSTELDITLLILILIVAAVSGNLLNYTIGKFFGVKLERSENRFVQNHLVKYIDRTRQFYQKNGAGSIVIGRFFPVIRTYIPFLAGIVEFPFRTFVNYTVLGAVMWVLLFTLTGYFVGEVEWVKNNYGLIFLGLIILTLLPFFYNLLKHFVNKQKAKWREKAN